MRSSRCYRPGAGLHQLRQYREIGCIDTASLLNWAAKCQRMGVRSVEGVMQAAGLVWADTVCGRDHQGRVNSGNFKAIQDYLVSLALLPGGGAV